MNTTSVPSLANNKEIFKQLVSQQYVLLFLFSPLRAFCSTQNTLANLKLILIYNSICYCIMLWWPSVYGIELKSSGLSPHRFESCPHFFCFCFNNRNKTGMAGRILSLLFIHHTIAESEKFRTEHNLFMLTMFVMKNSFKVKQFINKLYFVN